ncbi:MAG: hypothetical protein ACOWWH_10070 [Eubacteriaceae bacterium]
MDKLEIYNHILNIKETEYKNTLVIASIIEILIDKGIINKFDISIKAKELDKSLDNYI